METVTGTVIEVRPKALFRIRIENGHVLLCGIGPTLRHAIVRLVVGDRVLLKVSENDPHRGQIIQKAE